MLHRGESRSTLSGCFAARCREHERPSRQTGVVARCSHEGRRSTHAPEARVMKKQKYRPPA